MQFLRSLVFNIFLYTGLIFIFILAMPTLFLPSKFTLFFGRLSANYIVFIMRLILNTKVFFHGIENLKRTEKFTFKKKQRRSHEEVTSRQVSRLNVIVSHSSMSVARVVRSGSSASIEQSRLSFVERVQTHDGGRVWRLCGV